MGGKKTAYWGMEVDGKRIYCREHGLLRVEEGAVDVVNHLCQVSSRRAWYWVCFADGASVVGSVPSPVVLLAGC